MTIYVTKDYFVWLDVTDRVSSTKEREELWLSHFLYAIHDDESDSLLSTHEDVDEALRLGLRVCIEIGHLPDLEAKEKPCESGRA